MILAVVWLLVVLRYARGNPGMSIRMGRARVGSDRTRPGACGLRMSGGIGAFDDE